VDRLMLAKQIIGVGSVLVGIAALLAPRRVAAAAGIYADEAPEAVAAFGAKELATGGALLSPVKPGPFLWARLAGDLLDMGGLVAAFRRPGAKRSLILAGGAVVAVITFLDLITAKEAMDQGQ
jgi:hypothetical protein